MNQPYAAYQQTANATENPRDIEYRLLGQVTAALSQARENPKDVGAKIEAIMWNRSVWSAFRVDLLDPGNGLPKELRAQLISISIFVEKESGAAMDGTADLDALIDINRAIMEGLKPKASELSQQPAGTTPVADNSTVTGGTSSFDQSA